MNDQLSIEQRFALTRARYEVQRMSRPALEKTALRLLKSRDGAEEWSAENSDVKWHYV